MLPAPALPAPMAQLCQGCWVPGTLAMPRTSLWQRRCHPRAPKSLGNGLGVQERHCGGAATAARGERAAALSAALSSPGSLLLSAVSARVLLAVRTAPSPGPQAGGPVCSGEKPSLALILSLSSAAAAGVRAAWYIMLVNNNT